MAELPFLVVHGAFVWKVLLVVLVGGTAAITIAVRNRTARKRARAIATELVREVKPLAEGAACVRGVLRDGSLHTLSRTNVDRDHLEGTPVVECDDGRRIAIARAARVVAGSRATSSTLRVPTATPDPLADIKGAWVLSSVREGDEVVVRGTAKRAPQDASYRDDASGWTFEDDIVVGAVKPTARALPRHAVAQLAMVLAVAGVSYGLMYKIGSVAKSQIEERPELGDLAEIPSFGALAIACSMPGSCEDAMDEERRWFFERYGRRGSAFALHDALHRDDPCGLASAQMRQVRLEAALASVRACDDPEYEAWIQVFLGDYRAALALGPKRAIVREYAAVGAGDWKIAAEAADATIAKQESYEDADYFAKKTTTARCRAAWYRHLAGVTDPFAKVDAKTPTCQVFAALAKPASEQVTLLQALVEAQHALDYKHQDTWALWQARALLAMLGTRRDDNGNDLDVAFGVRGIAWLTAFETPATLAALEGQAGTAVLRGDFPAAHAAANAITDRRRRDSVLQWIALREGTPPPDNITHVAFDEQLALRAGTIPEKMYGFQAVYPEACQSRLRQAVETALTGDGLALARVFADCSVYYIYMPKLLFGILPRVKTGRAELADALRAFRHDITTFTIQHVPFQLVGDLADARDVARLVGDTEEVTRLQATIDRHVKMLADRNRTVAMFMLSR